MDQRTRKLINDILGLTFVRWNWRTICIKKRRIRTRQYWRLHKRINARIRTPHSESKEKLFRASSDSIGYLQLVRKQQNQRNLSRKKNGVFKRNCAHENLNMATKRKALRERKWISLNNSKKKRHTGQIHEIRTYLYVAELCVLIMLIKWWNVYHISKCSKFSLKE